MRSITILLIDSCVYKKDLNKLSFNTALCLLIILRKDNEKATIFLFIKQLHTLLKSESINKR